MIKIRIDVDYSSPSRLQNFISTTLNISIRKNYLKNSKIIAKMINESPEEVMAYWFFTPQTTPDSELLSLLHPEKHEVALHVATDPYLEWKKLEKATGRKVKYYTVHGTARLIARLMWRRKLWEARASNSTGFSIKVVLRFSNYWPMTGSAIKLLVDPSCKNRTKQCITKGEVLHVHPEWLFQRGTLNHRGPYYETLKTLLRVDTELEITSQYRRKRLPKSPKYPEQYEYLQDVVPSERFLEKLAERKVDIFTFIERKWCCPSPNPSSKWLKTEDNIALLKITPYAEWLNSVGKKTRNMIRKAEKSGVKTETVGTSEELAEGIWKIYNETPIRQGRAFSHYGGLAWKLLK